MENKHIKLTRHCACTDCGDTLAPGEWVEKIDGALYCHGCAEAIRDTQEFDEANWAEMVEGSYI